MSPGPFISRISPICAMRRLAVIGFAASLVTSLTACGGSGGGDAGDVARDGNNPILADMSLQQDDQSCIAEIDIAEFFLTEVDRQWSCEISSVVGTRFDEIYFDRRGTANTAGGDIWYWNRNLPSDDINLASPGTSPALMTDIGSSNTVLFFRTINDASVEEIYDCVLVGREISS